MRVKLKFNEYLRLHRIITGVSNVIIWEHLSEGRSFDDLLEKVPDEFYQWVKKTVSELLEQFNSIKAEAQISIKNLVTNLLPNRKDIAAYFKTQKYPAVLFAMLDGKPFDKIIWKMIKPAFAKAYKIDA